MQSEQTLGSILMASPDAAYLQSFGAALDALPGVSFTACSSGWEALAKAPVQLPDLILLDADMPMLDGPTTLAMLQRLPLLCNTQAIFLIGPGERRAQLRFALPGVLGAINRPPEARALVAGVWQMWYEPAARHAFRG